MQTLDTQVAVRHQIQIEDAVADIQLYVEDGFSKPWALRRVRETCNLPYTTWQRVVQAVSHL